MHLGEKLRFAHGFNTGFDADFGPHGGNRHTQFFVVDITVIRTGQGKTKAVGIARLFQQLTGAGDIIWMAFVLHSGYTGTHRAGQGNTGGNRQSAHHGSFQRLHINGLIQGQTHAAILERIFSLHIRIQQFVARLVKTQIDHARLAAFPDFHRLVAAQTDHILHRRIKHKINLPGFQRRHARGGIGDGAVIDGLHIALVQPGLDAPPVGIFLVCELDPLLPRNQPIGSGAHGVAGGEGLLFFGVVLRPDHIVFFAPRLVHHVDIGERVEHHRVGHRRGEFHREIINFSGDTGLVGIKPERHRRLARAVE